MTTPLAQRWGNMAAVAWRRTKAPGARGGATRCAGDQGVAANWICAVTPERRRDLDDLNKGLADLVVDHRPIEDAYRLDCIADCIALGQDKATSASGRAKLTLASSLASWMLQAHVAALAPPRWTCRGPSVLWRPARIPYLGSSQGLSGGPQDIKPHYRLPLGSARIGHRVPASCVLRTPSVKPYFRI